DPAWQSSSGTSWAARGSISERKIVTSFGAAKPRRTWLLRMATTVTRMLSPMMISSPTLRLRTSMTHFLAERDGIDGDCGSLPGFTASVVPAFAERGRGDFDAIDKRLHAFQARDRGLGHLT